MKSFFLIGADDAIHEVAGGRTISIGRAGINQIVLDDRLVSRIHTRITATPDGLMLVDRESVNGTCVNGRVVKETSLAHGDTIQIGRHVFCVLAGTQAEAQDWVHHRRGTKTDQTITGLNVSQIRDTDMIGDLSTFPLIPLLQTFVDQRRQGCLELRNGAQLLGRIFFNSGTIVHAEAPNGPTGKDAFFGLLPVDRGQFVFRAGIKPAGFSIQDNPTALLLEGCRRLDEKRAS